MWRKIWAWWPLPPSHNFVFVCISAIGDLENSLLWPLFLIYLLQVSITGCEQSLFVGVDNGCIFQYDSRTGRRVGQFHTDRFEFIYDLTCNAHMVVALSDEGRFEVFDRRHINQKEAGPVWRYDLNHV